MNQKTILCYGDSNTWGYIPNSGQSLTKSRYSRDERWTGLLQKKLGDDYYVIEEGLNSRTTNLDYAVPPDRNGKTYLPSCLYSHAPIDLVVVALGGNDMKMYFNRTAEEIKNGLSELVDIIQTSQYGSDMKQAPKVLIASLLIPLPIAESHIDENGIHFLKGAIKKAEKLIDLYAQLAQQKNCFYLDLSRDIQPSEIDGVHLDEDAHRKCAEIMFKKIQEIYST
jgi:lysophospholipase L1-like esterase